MSIVKEYIDGYHGACMTVKSLLVWDNIEDDDLAALEIPLKGEGQKISFQKQFETYYKECPLRSQDLEGAETTFFIIFDENRLLIDQIKRHKEEIKLLSNPENGQNSTLLYSLNVGSTKGDSSMNQGGFATIENKSQDGGQDITSIDNNGYVATNAANSDSNSQYEKLEDYEEQPKIETNKEGDETDAEAEESESEDMKTKVEEVEKVEKIKKSKIPTNPLEISILANQLSQNRTLNIAEKELTLIKGTKNDTSTTTTSSSSTISVNNIERESAMVGKNVKTMKASESLRYLRAEIPKLRSKFISKFSTLFII